MHLPPIDSKRAQIVPSNDANAQIRNELHSTSSLTSSKSTSCLGSIISAIQSFFRAIYQLITCGLLKTTESPQEKEEETGSEVEESEPSLSSSENSSEVDEPPTPPDLPTTSAVPVQMEPPDPEIIQEAATQFLDDFYADPVSTAKTVDKHDLRVWQKNCPSNTDVKEFWKNTFVHFLCSSENRPPENESAPSWYKPLSIQYKGQVFNIKHWMIEYYINKYNPDLTQKDLDEQCPLHFARSKKTALLLLNKHPELIEQLDKRGYTPLITASHEGLPEVVECLIANNANCHATSKEFGDTALHQTRSLSVAKQLLTKSPSLLNATNLSSSTPLHYAALLGKEELVRFYIEQGADLCIPDKSGAFSVVSCLSPRIAELFLLKDSELAKYRNDEGNTPLCFAKTAEMVQFFLYNGADIESKNYADETPLSVLLEKGSIQAAEALILRGANSAINVGKEPLLHFLLAKSTRDDYRALFKTVFRPQDVNIVDTTGRTLLQHTLEQCDSSSLADDYFNIALFLIENKANTDFKMKEKALREWVNERSDNNNWKRISIALTKF